MGGSAPSQKLSPKSLPQEILFLSTHLRGPELAPLPAQLQLSLPSRLTDGILNKLIFIQSSAATVGKMPWEQEAWARTCPASSALGPPTSFLPHLPQDVQVLAGCEGQTRRCVRTGLAQKPPCSAWSLQFGAAAWVGCRVNPRTAWLKGCWAGGLLGKGKELSLEKQPESWSCQCLWCKDSSHGRCPMTTLRGAGKRCSHGTLGACMSPCQVPASQGCASFPLDLEPQGKEALCLKCRARRLLRGAGAGQPSPRKACGHLAPCVYQMPCITLGERRMCICEAPTRGGDGEGPCRGRSLAEGSSRPRLQGPREGPVPHREAGRSTERPP